MPIKKHKENEDDYFYLKISNENVCRFLSYQHYIEDNLKNNPVALRVFKRMIFLMKPKDDDKENYYYKIVDTISDAIISTYKKDKKYYFSYKVIATNYEEDIPNLGVKKSKKSNPYYTVFSFDNMIREAVFPFIEAFELNKDKEYFYGKCYEVIDNYLSNNKRIRKDYSHYKICALVGFISLKLGYKISDEIIDNYNDNVMPTNSELFNAVKYCTDNYNTYSKNKKRR